MKTKKYAIFEPNLIFNGIKYQVGKRYKKKEFLFIDTNIRKLFLDYFEIYDITKQIQIRVIDEYDDYYIICNEINYYNDFDHDVEDTIKNLFLLLRYRDKDVINKDMDSMSIYEKTALYDLHYSYFINLILQRNFENLTKKILENKLFLTQLKLVNGLKSTTLDDLIKKNVTNLNEEIIKYGYDKHIDYFKNKKEYSYEVLKRNRKQDYHLIKDLEPTEKRNLLFEGNEEHVKILEMEEKKDELFVKAIKLYKKNNSFFDYNKDFITLLKINENVIFIIEYFNKINNPLLLIHSKEYKNDEYIENDDFDDDNRYNAIHNFYHKWQNKIIESLTEKEYKEIKEDIMQLKRQFKFIDLFYYNYSNLEERIKWLLKNNFDGGNK